VLVLYEHTFVSETSFLGFQLRDPRSKIRYRERKREREREMPLVGNTRRTHVRITFGKRRGESSSRNNQRGKKTQRRRHVDSETIRSRFDHDFVGEAPDPLDREKKSEIRAQIIDSILKLLRGKRKKPKKHLHKEEKYPYDVNSTRELFHPVNRMKTTTTATVPAHRGRDRGKMPSSSESGIDYGLPPGLSVQKRGVASKKREEEVEFVPVFPDLEQRDNVIASNPPRYENIKPAIADKITAENATSQGSRRRQKFNRESVSQIDFKESRIEPVPSRLSMSYTPVHFSNDLDTIRDTSRQERQSTSRLISLTCPDIQSKSLVSAPHRMDFVLGEDVRDSHVGVGEPAVIHHHNDEFNNNVSSTATRPDLPSVLADETSPEEVLEPLQHDEKNNLVSYRSNRFEGDVEEVATFSANRAALNCGPAHLDVVKASEYESAKPFRVSNLRQHRFKELSVDVSAPELQRSRLEAPPRRVSFIMSDSEMSSASETIFAGVPSPIFQREIEFRGIAPDQRVEMDSEELILREELEAEIERKIILAGVPSSHHHKDIEFRGIAPDQRAEMDSEELILREELEAEIERKTILAGVPSSHLNKDIEFRGIAPDQRAEMDNKELILREELEAEIERKIILAGVPSSHLYKDIEFRGIAPDRRVEMHDKCEFILQEELKAQSNETSSTIEQGVPSSQRHKRKDSYEAIIADRRGSELETVPSRVRDHGIVPTTTKDAVQQGVPSSQRHKRKDSYEAITADRRGSELETVPSRVRDHGVAPTTLESKGRDDVHEDAHFLRPDQPSSRIHRDSIEDRDTHIHRGQDIDSGINRLYELSEPQAAEISLGSKPSTRRKSDDILSFKNIQSLKSVDASSVIRTLCTIIQKRHGISEAEKTLEQIRERNIETYIAVTEIMAKDTGKLDTLPSSLDLLLATIALVERHPEKAKCHFENVLNKSDPTNSSIQQAMEDGLIAISQDMDSKTFSVSILTKHHHLPPGMKVLYDPPGLNVGLSLEGKRLKSFKTSSDASSSSSKPSEASRMIARDLRDSMRESADMHSLLNNLSHS